MITNRSILIPLLFSIIISPCSHAQTIYELEATPAAFNLNGQTLLITEVSFKNSVADWAEIYYSSNNKKDLNLNQFSFKDDSIFKRITGDYIIKPGSYIILNFKTEQSDQPPNLYTKRSGLTGTTEQLILQSADGNIIDAICWASDSPTESEIKDQEELYKSGGWNSPNTSLCVQSEKIKSNQSIIRNSQNDTNSITDWQISSSPTPGQENTTSEQEKTLTIETVTISNQDLPQNNLPQTPSSNSITQTSTTSQKNNSSTKTTSKKTSSATTKQPTSTTKNKKTTSKKTSKSAIGKYKNGTLSSNLLISEIYPNPATEDTKIEWIELENQGESEINLGNWQLDDKDGGSKPYLFPDTTIIPAGETILISSTTSKLSLSNSGEEIRLINFKNQVINSITYPESPKGKSYAFVRVISDQENSTPESKWIWTDFKTPGTPNPVYYQFNGTITSAPKFNTDYTFRITTNNTQEKEITFTEDVMQAPLAKITLIPGSTGEFLCRHDEANQKYILTKYEIIKTAPSANNLKILLPGIAGILLIVLSSAVLIFRKKLFHTSPTH